MVVYSGVMNHVVSMVYPTNTTSGLAGLPYQIIQCGGVKWFKRLAHNQEIGRFESSPPHPFDASCLGSLSYGVKTEIILSILKVWCKSIARYLSKGRRVTVKLQITVMCIKWE